MGQCKRCGWVGNDPYECGCIEPEEALEDDRHEAIRQGRTNVCVCGLLVEDDSAHR